jgi:peptide/nickel transport system permease protein
MRAGSIKALESDYARTATMKGLNDRQLIRRHVIRNAIPPTITVISVQIGYLFGGIIAVEKVFNYSGIGQQIFVAVSAKDLPLLQGCVLIVGTIYMLATLTADIIIAWLNPRVRLQVGSS